MSLVVSELQARVSADTGDAERGFERLRDVQNQYIASSKDVEIQSEKTGEAIDEAAKKGGQSWNDFSEKFGSIAGKLTSLGAGLSLAITAPIVKIGDDALKTAVRFDSLKRGLTAVMGSSKAAGKEIEKLKEIAKVPGLGIEEAEKGSLRLQSATLSAKEAERALLGFGNALATVGSGKEELEGVNLALTQIATKGKVMGQDIRQLQERVPQIRKIMLDTFGSADTEILQRADITSKEFIDHVTDALLKLPKVAGGIKNDIQNLGDKWKLTLNEMGIAMFPLVRTISDMIIPAMQKLTDTLKEMSPEQKNMIVWAILIVAALGPFLTVIGLLATGLKNTIELFMLLSALTKKDIVDTEMDTVAKTAQAVAIDGVAAACSAAAVANAAMNAEIVDSGIKALPAASSLMVYNGATASINASLTSLNATMVETEAVTGGLGTALSTFALGPLAIVGIAVGSLFLAWKYNWGGMRDTVNSIFTQLKQSFLRWAEFTKDTWKDWTEEVQRITISNNKSIQSVLMEFRIFWETFWTGIALFLNTVFGVMKVSIDFLLGAIRGIILVILDLINLDFKKAWKDIEKVTEETWDNIEKDTKNSLDSIQGQFKNYYSNMQTIVTDGQKKIANAAAQNPIVPANILPNGMMVSHSAHPLPTVSDNRMMPSHTTPNDLVLPMPVGGVDMSNGLDAIRKRVQDILNKPKKVKLTPEQRQTNAALKELNDLKAQSNALDKGASDIASDVAGKYNLVSKSIIDQIVQYKESIKAKKDAADYAAKQARDLVTENLNFHEYVKKLEADKRDLLAGTKVNSISAEFPHQKKDMLDYASSLKMGNTALKEAQDENKRFNQTLSETKGQIQSLLSNDGMAALRAQYKGMVSDDDLKKLNEANIQLKLLQEVRNENFELLLSQMSQVEKEAATFAGVDVWSQMSQAAKDNAIEVFKNVDAQKAYIKSLQELKTASDKVEILQLPKNEQKPATTLGIDVWRNMTLAAKENTIAIFDNIKAQNDLEKSLTKANEQIQKRADAITNFSDAMQQRLAAARANALGDSAGAAFEKLLAGDSVLRDALGNGPTQEKSNAMKQFFEVFNEEANTKKILETASAMEKFNTDMNESIKLAQIRLQGQGDSVEAEWQRFLLNNHSLADKFDKDTKASTEAFKRFKQSFDLTQQADTLEKFQSTMGDLHKQILMLKNSDPFEQFRISMMELKNGQLIQPFTEDQLKEMFNYKQIVDIATQMQSVFENAFQNLRNGFDSFFDTIVQGFEKMLQDMAAKWLSSQLVNLVVRVLGNVLNVDTSSFGLTGRATGGPVSSGQAYIVGERGPELFVPNQNGRIEPDMPTGNSYQIVFNIQTPDAQSFRQSQGQIFTDMKRQVDYMEQRNVSKSNRSR